MSAVSPMPDDWRAADLDRLEDARHVLGEGSHPIRQSLYAVYVTVLLGLTYGLTVSRALFLTGDPGRLRDQLLSWPVAAGLAAAAALGTWVAHRTGRSRGPVVPPMPWIDVVATTPLDRALSLRRWWGLAVTGAMTGGVVLGGVVGGGLWIAHVGGPVWLAGGLAVGLVIAVLLLAAWLAGQATLSPRGNLPRTNTPRNALRRLAVDDLRRQAARSTRLGGALLLADVRAIRLEVSAPVTRGRSLHLRPGGPIIVVARRDLLGLRRMPGGLASGAALTGFGGAVVGWSSSDGTVPLVFACLALFPCYFGYGAWAEGLRLQGDNAGTPPLIGLDTRHEAPAHLIVPTVLFVGVAGVASLAVAVATHGELGHRHTVWAVGRSARWDPRRHAPARRLPRPAATGSQRHALPGRIGAVDRPADAPRGHPRRSAHGCRPGRDRDAVDVRDRRCRSPRRHRPVPGARPRRGAPGLSRPIGDDGWRLPHLTPDRRCWRPPHLRFGNRRGNPSPPLPISGGEPRLVVAQAA